MAKIFHDTFTEASFTELSLHTPDIGTGAWEQLSGASTLINVSGGGGYALGESSSSSSSYLNTQQFDESIVDISITAKLVSSSNRILVCWFRINENSTTNNGYRWLYSNGEMYIEKRTAGVSTQLGLRATVDWSVDEVKTFRVTQDGAALKLYVDDVLTLDRTDGGTPYTNAGLVGISCRSTIQVDEMWVDSSGADTTPPTLTSATATATGATTASGSVTTDEGNGALYSVATTSATAPSKAQVKAGQDHTGSAAAWNASQAISSTGAKSVSVTGLTAETTYYLHHMHEDAAENQSDVVSSASFTTTGAFASTVSVTDPLKNNTGTLLASQSGVKVAVLKAADLASVYEGTATTNASGILSDITDAAIVAGSYHVAIKLTDGSVGITGAIEAV